MFALMLKMSVKMFMSLISVWVRFLTLAPVLSSHHLVDVATFSCSEQIFLTSAHKLQSNDSVQPILFNFKMLKIYLKGRDRSRQRSPVSAVAPLCAYRRLGWARLKWRAGNSMHICLLSVGNPLTWANTCCILRQLQSGTEAESELSHSTMSVFNH